MSCLRILLLTAPFLLTGSSSRPPRHIAPSESEPTAVRELKQQAAGQYQKGSFSAAANLFENAYLLAAQAHSWKLAISLKNNAAGARLANGEYRPALEAFLTARSLAQEHGQRSSLGFIWFNLSALYLALNDVRAATDAAEQGLAAIGPRGDVPYRPRLLTQLGYLRSLEGKTDEALAQFREAIESANQVGDLDLVSTAAERAALALMSRRQFNEAEPYLLLAYRLRKLFHSRELTSSLLYLSQLRLSKGDVESASALIQEVIPTGEANSIPPLAYYQLGEVRLAQSRLPEAQAAFRQAVEAAERWREGTLTSDRFRSETAISVHQQYQAFIDASLALGGKANLEAMVAVERDRAASLRESIAAARPPVNESGKYAEVLEKLGTSESLLLAKNTPENRIRVQQLRLELSEIESSAAANGNSAFGNNTEEKSIPEEVLRDFQKNLRPEEALLSFYQSPKGVAVWVLSQDRLEFHDAGSAERIRLLANRFQDGVLRRSDDRDVAAQELYQVLFGGLSREMQAKKRWILAANDWMFDIPFAALVAGRANERPKYLAELHSILYIPSAFMLSRKGEEIGTGGFLGIADAIYNSADPRLGRQHGRSTSLQLARLVSSSSEVQNCARLWNGTPYEILTGKQVSLGGFRAGLKKNPAIVHIAAHYVTAENRPDRVAVDLGIQPDGTAQLLMQEELMQLSASGAVVVMSGCSSGASGAIGGAGILGLSRGWLVAGAASVMGSRWPTPDDTGELLQKFYSHLKAARWSLPSSRAVADSLESAQVQMLQSGTWRSDPSYWGAFYVIGKE